MCSRLRSAPLWLALTLGLPAQATTPDDALRAADPAQPAAARPLLLPAPQRLDAPESPADLDRARAVWREANQRVAEFPRGHIDLLRWEAAQARDKPAAGEAAPTPAGLAEALRASLRQRPDLFTHAGMNALAKARVRVAYAGHVRDLQHAWIDAVALHERVRLRAAVLDAARSGSELGRRMVHAGNWPMARLLQEQLIESTAWQANADAALAAHAALQHLAGLMGIWRADEVRALGERLGAPTPTLPALPEHLQPADGLAVDGIEAAVLRADPLLALEATPARRAFDGLPAGRWAAWSDARDAAIAALPEPTQGSATPPHIDDLSLLREHRLLEADEHRARLLARASERRAMARNAWAQLQARHAGAWHTERVLAGLKDAQQQETLLRYNGMFDSTWQLLASARERLDALDAALMARRAYWRAQASWQALLAGADFRLDDATGAPMPAGGNATGDTDMDLQRRHLFAGAVGAVAAASVSRVALAALPEAVQQTSADTAAPWTPPGVTGAGRPYDPVVTLNGWTLPWRMNSGVKEFHLVAEPVVREVAPGFHVNMWGYNGQSPGPTIEVVEGDRVRIYVTNRLPEHTTIHWHGQRLPNGMDGVGGLNQPQIPVGKTFVYEFVARRPGTFMYHPHADEMVQMAMGMMGFWVTHPKQKHPLIEDVQRDYCFLLNAFDVTPGSRTPQVNTMLEHNIWCWNSRVFPGITPLVARLGDRVRVRVGNLTMTNHPIHIHGIEFEVTGTDGGPTPKGSRWPEVTADVAVGQMRQLEFIADEPGDWAMHCHKSHHTMGAMGHGVPTMIGVDHRGLVAPLQRAAPDYMVMGERGMADMGEMQMELPANTFPMMTGTGPYGPIEMGGMFTTLKVRADQKPGDYSDPGNYAMPPGTQARLVETASAPTPDSAAPTAPTPKAAADARKPAGHHHH